MNKYLPLTHVSIYHASVAIDFTNSYAIPRISPVRRIARPLFSVFVLHMALTASLYFEVDIIASQFNLSTGL